MGKINVNTILLTALYLLVRSQFDTFDPKVPTLSNTPYIQSKRWCTQYSESTDMALITCTCESGYRM